MTLPVPPKTKSSRKARAIRKWLRVLAVAAKKIKTALPAIRRIRITWKQHKSTPT
jgi:hypothetical protein